MESPMTKISLLHSDVPAPPTPPPSVPPLPPTPENPEGVPPAIDDPRPTGSPGPVQEPLRPPLPIVAVA